MPIPKQDARLNENVLKFARREFVRVLVHQTVAEALEFIRRHPVKSRIVYFYVVDDDSHLKGILPTRKLLLSSPDQVITELMQMKFHAVPDSATLFDACDLFLFHRLLALPVVDADGRMVGVIDVETYTDQLSDAARQMESNDFFQLMGVRLAEIRQASLSGVFLRRFPWLLCNLAGGLGCALVAGLFEEVLDKVIVLALFLPLVLTLAESVSIQSLTLTLQMQHGRFEWDALRGGVVREAPIALLLGISCGLLVAVIAWMWQGLELVALCILLSIFLSVAAAGLFGLLIPNFLGAIQKDPKIASGPITLAITDLTALFIYLGLASMLL